MSLDLEFGLLGVVEGRWVKTEILPYLNAIEDIRTQWHIIDHFGPLALTFHFGLTPHGVG